MNKLGIEDLNIDEAIFKIRDLEDCIKIKISGSVDLREPDKILDPYFDKIHKSILKNNIKELICDIKELVFINSSGIKSLLNWIIRINDLKKNKKYKIIFLHNEEITWQKTSLKTLSYLVPKQIIIEK